MTDKSVPYFINKKLKLSLSLFLGAFIIFYFIDAYFKINLRLYNDLTYLNKVVKGIFELIAIFFGIVFINKTRLNILFSILILSVFFGIGSLLVSRTIPDFNWFENISLFFKLLFVFSVFLLVYDIIKYHYGQKSIWKVYKYLITINSLLVITGFLFSIDVLRTYDGPWRFGYDGLIAAQNEASYIFIFALATVYYRRYYLNRKEFIFWLVLFSSLLVGTKAVYVTVMALFLFHLTQRISLKKIIVMLFSSVALGYMLFYSAINKILLNAWQVLQYNIEREGLAFALLSGRNVFIKTKLIPLITEHWNILNFLIGGHDIKFYMEMGLLDIFLFFGIIGGLLYLYVFIRIYNFVQFERKFKIFFFLMLLGLIALSGHFFESAIAGMYFIMFILTNQNKGVNT